MAQPASPGTVRKTSLFHELGYRETYIRMPSRPTAHSHKLGISYRSTMGLLPRLVSTWTLLPTSTGTLLHVKTELRPGLDILDDKDEADGSVSYFRQCII